MASEIQAQCIFLQNFTGVDGARQSLWTLEVESRMVAVSSSQKSFPQQISTPQHLDLSLQKSLLRSKLTVWRLVRERENTVPAELAILGLDNEHR